MLHINMIANVASLAIFLAGLVFFIYSIKRVKTGIGSKEFISCNYIFEKIDLGYGKKKNILLRRLQISDIIAIGEMPNWIQMMMIKDGNEALKKIQEDEEKKTPEERLEESKKYYEFLQRVAEKAIVRWKVYLKEWQDIDPECTGKLPDVVLQTIFNAILNNVNFIVKKKTSFNVWQLLGKNSEKHLAPILKTETGTEQMPIVSL